MTACDDCGRPSDGVHLGGCLNHPSPGSRHPFAAVLDDLPPHIGPDGPACGGFEGCPACANEKETP